MPVLLVSSQRPLVGKTAIAVAIAQRLNQDGYRPRLARLATAEQDAAAQADARCFASLSLAADKKGRPLSLDEVAKLVKGASPSDTALIVELPAAYPPGEATRALAGPLVMVERAAALNADNVAALHKELGKAFVGLVVTAVPRPRAASIADTLSQQGIPVLALLPEDRLLSSPTIGEMAQSLQAEILFADGRTDEVLERLTIAPISADPGQAHFARFARQAVVVRCDRPDLQLAALNADSLCLILSGGQRPLAYVSERAEAEGVPLLITAKDTLAAVQTLEALHFESRFSHQKAERIGQLMAEHLDYKRFRQALGLRSKGRKAS
ncbi:MAG: DRTGG domain-containing protein [Dehalococcoidia bacterium]